MIIRHRVKHMTIDPSFIFSVDHFSHQEKIILDLIRKFSKSYHKIKIQYLSDIQPESIDIEFIHPESDCIQMIIDNIRISQIELCKDIVSSPGIIGKSVIEFVVSIEIDILIPVKILTAFFFFSDILKRKEISSAVIEYCIKYE